MWISILCCPHWFYCTFFWCNQPARHWAPRLLDLCTSMCKSNDLWRDHENSLGQLPEPAMKKSSCNRRSGKELGGCVWVVGLGKFPSSIPSVQKGTMKCLNSGDSPILGFWKRDCDFDFGVSAHSSKALNTSWHQRDSVGELFWNAKQTSCT